jgi:hypothetical protein
MPLPRPGDWRYSLADHHGVWCCYCFKYIGPSEFNAHHILKQHWIRKRFGPRFPVGPTVPAHCGECHQGGIQHFADAATEHLKQVLERVDLYDEPTRDRLAKRAHDQGLYWVATLINLDTARSLASQNRRDEMLTTVEYLLGSAAGTRGIHSLPKHLPLRHDEAQSPGVLLHLASGAANMGFHTRARDLLRSAEETLGRLPSKRRLRWAASHHLRRAQIERSERDSEIAGELSVSDYSKTTALLLRSQIFRAQGSPVLRARARELLEDLLARGDQVSWLYRATCWLNFAYHVLDSDRLPKDTLRVAYRLLVKAQYVFVMLGLLGTPEPTTLLRGHTLKHNFTPVDLLLSLTEFSKFSPEECLDMRQQAIAASWLREQMIMALTDWWHGYVKEAHASPEPP